MGPVAAQEAEVNGERANDEDAEAEAKRSEKLVLAHASLLLQRQYARPQMVAEGAYRG
jgi:hypothetical protein